MVLLSVQYLCFSCGSPHVLIRFVMIVRVIFRYKSLAVSAKSVSVSPESFHACDNGGLPHFRGGCRALFSLLVARIVRRGVASE